MSGVETISPSDSASTINEDTDSTHEIDEFDSLEGENMNQSSWNSSSDYMS